jgi:hypothetical protein
LFLFFVLIWIFNQKIEILGQLNVILALVVTKSYWLSVDFRIFLITCLLFLAIVKIVPTVKIQSSLKKANLLELIILVFWTWLIYYFYGYKHSEDKILGVVFNLMYLLKWYMYWIVYRLILSPERRKGILSICVLVFSVVSPLLYDGRTDIFLLIFLIAISLIKYGVKRVRHYTVHFLVFSVFFAVFSLYTATRNLARYNENLTVKSLVENSTWNELQDLVTTYTLERIAETSKGATELLSMPPIYFATYSHLPQVLIPRFLYPDKGFFLPGLYYEELLGGYRTKVGDKNREVGFIGIWWHNFGFASVVYVFLLFGLILLVKNLEPMFLLFWVPKLFGDYNSIPVLIVMLISYLIIKICYVPYTRFE